MASAAAQRDLQRVTLAYYFRHGLLQTAAEKTSDWLARRNEPLLLFWKLVALGLTGSVAEAIRGLQALQTRRETEFPAMMALLYFHKLASIVDKDSVDTLEASLPAAQSTSTDSSLLMAANFRLYTGQYADAASLVDRLIPSSGVPQTPMQHQAQVVAAWADLLAKPATRREEESRASVLSRLERVSETLEMDVLMARAAYFDIYGHPQQALECLNQTLEAYARPLQYGQAVALQPSFSPALVEKARILMALGDWDLANEVLQRVLSQEADNVEACRLLTLHALTREASPKVHLQKLKQLQGSMEKLEGRNDRLLYVTSRLFARLAGRWNREAIRITLELVERAAKLAPGQHEYLTEVGNQCLMLGDTVGAMDAFRQAAKLNQMSVEALHGMVRCQVVDGQLEDAEQQMEFLTVIHESLGPSTQAPFLQAQLAWRRQKDAKAQLGLLDRVLDIHMAAYREASKGGAARLLARFEALDPDFLLTLAQEYLVHVSLIPRSGQAAAMTVDKAALLPVQKGLQVLEKLVAELPGLVVAQMEMARAHLAIGELEAAGAILEEAARVDPTSSECQLLLARVALAQENHRMASSHLEQALSNDFQVRSSPIYHLVKAQILGNQGALEEALMQLQEAGQLDGGGGAHMALSDRISIMLETMAVLSKLGRLQEAQAALTQAQGAARGSAEEVRVLLANAELAIRRNDVDGALKGLSGVPKGSPAYVQAQMFRANVYLTHRHDRRAYAQCYLDLVNSRADAATYVLLGEAYMRIQAPESAIEAFQAALDLNPSDNELAIKIGRALVSTHDYRKAMDYYESALVQAPHNGQLRQDLARLYSKLGKHTMAAGILQHSVENATAQTDMASLCVVVKNLLLLAEVHAASGDHDDVLDALTRAWNLQRSVLERCRGERPDLLPEQRRVAADICFRMGQHHNKVDDERAVECYNDALRIDEAFEPALVALARLHKRLGRPEDCARHCKTLLRINAKQAEQASMLLGELAFLKGDYDGATNHYRALLEKKPNNYPALVQLLALLRGAGKLDEAKGFIERAGAADPRSSSHLGMAFCKGLYYRYTRDVAEAVRYLNLARKDGEWAVRALEALIEIYVDPDGTLLSEEDISASEDSSAPAARADAAATENLKVAEKLLAELGKVSTDSRRTAVLTNYFLLASKTKANIDRASSGFIELIEADKEYLPALLGVSTSFILKRQPEKARNTLRMIAKMPYNHDFADEFEKSYLLLAELYVVKAKYDLAQDLCRKCLGYNKSCGEAWDLMGRIMEKEQAFRDAADCYEKAWQLEHEASAAVGFKLAFNYLKAKRFVDATNVCHKVLQQYPDYPRIRDEILEKAISALRPAAAQ